MLVWKGNFSRFDLKILCISGAVCTYKLDLHPWKGATNLIISKSFSMTMSFFLYLLSKRILTYIIIALVSCSFFFKLQAYFRPNYCTIYIHTPLQKHNLCRTYPPNASILGGSNIHKLAFPHYILKYIIAATRNDKLGLTAAFHRYYTYHSMAIANRFSQTNFH